MLKVSASGYYYWKNAPKSNRQIEQEVLEDLVKDIFYAHKRRYGAVRIARELKKRDIGVNEKRVRIVMRRLGLQAKGTRKPYQNKSTLAQRSVAKNLLNRIFSTSVPNKVWMGDITYIRTEQGWMYLCVFIDAYSRKVVGWATSHRLTKELAMQAFSSAVGRRNPVGGFTVHTDQGSQFSSKAFDELLRKHGAIPSMSRKGNPYDNAVVESFYRTLKRELIEGRYKTRHEAKQEIFHYIELYYNTKRMHSALGYLSPTEYERRTLT